MPPPSSTGHSHDSPPSSTGHSHDSGVLHLVGLDHHRCRLVGAIGRHGLNLRSETSNHGGNLVLVCNSYMILARMKIFRDGGYHVS
ncbi:hypothetical protein PVAP13_9KG338700 [Panicum virgatum]|uniref:Uncharacterized protein n=1 Tax=Panicum virgatum TaxID=38727 RepID=A0A8T0NTV1_PANVG|nr:hypothetical protein PVAP13_9KG338700 [Panicum virgatum]